MTCRPQRESGSSPPSLRSAGPEHLSLLRCCRSRASRPCRPAAHKEKFPPHRGWCSLFLQKIRPRNCTDRFPGNFRPEYLPCNKQWNSRNSRAPRLQGLWQGLSTVPVRLKRYKPKYRRSPRCLPRPVHFRRVRIQARSQRLEGCSRS